MEGIPAIYLGRILSQFDKDKFRAYIYSQDGVQKLVNSWEEFETHIESGTWFDSKEKTKQNVKPFKSNKK